MCRIGKRVLLSILLFLVANCAMAQIPAAPAETETPAQLEQKFFAILRNGNSQQFLSYISKNGVNIGAQAQHTRREEVDQQFESHRGIYCKLFDSSCINSPINLENSARTCSYRELLTHSKNVRTAASEVTRSGVRQAVLVAEIKNDNCANGKLIDFIFNLDADGWKLFSIP